jgi:hypothetical protein
VVSRTTSARCFGITQPVIRAADEALITDQVMKYCAFYYSLSLRERAGVRGENSCKTPPHPVLLPEGEGTWSMRWCALFTARLSKSPVRPESFDSPFGLSLSKTERLAQDRLVEG